MSNLPSNDAFSGLKNHASFDSNAPTLEDLMLQGEANESWTNICEKIGHLLATTRNTIEDIDVAKVFVNESISEKSVLGKWIDKINSSWDEAIKSIVPPSASRSIHLNSERLKERGNQVVELLDSGRLCRSLSKLQLNLNGIELVYGPLGLELAVFLADILIKYHQQLRLEHSLRYVTSDCARSFGRSFHSKINNSDDTERKQFWAQTSLLTGWEIVRRVNEDHELRQWSIQNDYDLVDVFEAGLRLVYNAHIDNVDFMITIALAEIF